MQETFLKIHRGRASFLPTLPLRPWVFTIAAHVRQDELRRRYRLREDCGEEELVKAEERRAIEVAADGESSVDARQDALAAALARLPESQRVVLTLHRFEGLGFREIGAILGTSEVAARGRAFRAYEQLRKALAPANAGEGRLP